MKNIVFKSALPSIISNRSLPSLLGTCQTIGSDLESLLPDFQQRLVICRLPQSHFWAGARLPSTNYILDNFILINADAFLLALILYLQSIWYKLLELFCCTKPAPANKVLAHVSTGALKLPLCLQEPVKLLIAFCANGPYALDKVSGKSGTGWRRLQGTLLLQSVNETENVCEKFEGIT